MTVEILKAARAKLEADRHEAALALSAFPKVGPHNVTPDAVKAAPEWKSAYASFWAAHNALRAFNGRYARVLRAAA